jgi:hypothetical protein
MRAGIRGASEGAAGLAPVAVPMRQFLDEQVGPVLVLHDPSLAGLVAPLAGPGVTVLPVDGKGWVPAPGQRWSAVLLAVPDRAALRRCASYLPATGPVKTVACWLGEANEPVAVLPRADWPDIILLNARRTQGGAALTTITFLRQIAGLTVLAELARRAVPERRSGNEGVFVATTEQALGMGAPADPSTLVVETPDAAADPTRDIPPDLVLTMSQDDRGRSLPVHAVIDRAPAVLVADGPFAQPIDEAVINPRQFRRDWDEGVVDLRMVGPRRFVLGTEGGDLVLNGVRGVTERVVRKLRRVQGVALDWPEKAVGDHARIVAGLAMAGVPLLGPEVPASSRAVLGDELAGVLDLKPDLTSELRREEHSIRLRRAALREHSVVAWRSRVAAAAGVRFQAYPSVSILLATKRPHQLEFVLKQIRKQQGVDIELVLAAHGWQPDAGRVRELLGDIAVTILTLGSDTSFGDVLNAAAAAASGDVVLKFDDDDWYGPESVSDLLLARTYSGADVVGCTAEFAFLEPLWRMVRRNDQAERNARFVAGGTMMMDRSTLRSFGGFRSVQRYVDASLLACAHAAGASVYRTHGLGYVLRRSAGGHTWAADLDYFLDPKRLAEQWDGFVPSELLVHDVDELPERGSGILS